jgi:hypothetical protein
MPLFYCSWRWCTRFLSLDWSSPAYRKRITATSTLHMWNENVVQQFACMCSCHFLCQGLNLFIYLFIDKCVLYPINLLINFQMYVYKIFRSVECEVEFRCSIWKYFSSGIWGFMSFSLSLILSRFWLGGVQKGKSVPLQVLGAQRVPES